MNHVAIDIGASGGTVFLGRVTDAAFEVEAVDRFENYPVEEHGRYVWDVDALEERIVGGLRAADDRADGLDTVAIDTWGLDFGLVSDGSLLRNPISYRDPGATATKDAVLETAGKHRLFETTGITNWRTPNTLWQLHTIAREEPALLERADGLLMMPQLLSARLGGRPTGEVTIASTTQMVDPIDRDWATELLRDLSIPTDLLPELEGPGTKLGPVGSAVADELSTTPDLVAPASHDTASAVAGLPLDDDAAFLSTGSWFILGIERSEPILADDAFEYGFSNELGVDGTVRLLKNVNGFFLLEECRNAWRDAGRSVEYERLLAEARAAPSRVALVDPDDESFGIDGSTPEQIRAYCRRTDQPVPSGRGEIVRCLVESLAAKTALALDELSAVAESSPARISLGGGGARNDLFCQLLADATDRPVEAGPVEATAIGNVLTQALAAGTVPDVETGRRLIADEFAIRTYEPADDGGWERAKRRLAALIADGD